MTAEYYSLSNMRTAPPGDLSKCIYVQFVITTLKTWKKKRSVYEPIEINEQTFNEITTWVIKTGLATLNKKFPPETFQT